MTARDGHAHGPSRAITESALERGSPLALEDLMTSSTPSAAPVTSNVSPFWVALVVLLGFLTLGLGWLKFLGIRRWIRSIGPEGVESRSGLRLPWSKLKLVRPLY